MKRGWFVFTAGVAAFAGGVAACTASADNGDYKEPPSNVAIPDAADDAATADADVDAGPCLDCEHFPAECTPDAFCPSALFDSDETTSLDGRTTINMIRGRSANDVWAVGSGGGIAHFDGTSWKRSETESQLTLWGVWLPAGVEVAFASLDPFFARGVAAPDGGTTTAGGWTQQKPVYASGHAPPAGPVIAEWSPPGGEWTWVATRNGAPWRLRRTSTGEIEGSTGVSRSACSVLRCERTRSLHGAAAGALWAIGTSGSAIRISDAQEDAPTGKRFNTQTMKALNGVWEASASDAWAVGAGGTIRHYTGDPLVWEIVADVPTDLDLNAIWGFSSSDIWAVGDSGLVLHYDGTSWSRVKVAGLGSDRPNLTTVWGPAPGHVWIGGHGVMLSLGGTP